MKTPLFTASSIAALGSATLILDSERRHIAKANGAPDAAFIVRACNSHAQLVAALRTAATALGYIALSGDRGATAAVNALEAVNATLARLDSKA